MPPSLTAKEGAAILPLDEQGKAVGGGHAGQGAG
jgi:hypothetical protein